MINNYIIQIFLIITLLGCIIFFFRVNSLAQLEKRYMDFCVPVINDRTIPVMTIVTRRYDSIKKRISKRLYKFKGLIDYSKKYEKYCDKSKIIRTDPMDFISNKVMFGISFMILIVLSDIFRYVPVSFMQLSASFLIGFFVPDIYWIIKDKQRKKQLEQDMLKAIIIMNNSFKSGLSIMQAIYMVSKELDGPISEEFRKMYIDISFGLEMDLVFKRFANRVGTDDARYITTSLSVLNKTGGNIVQVFASVERNSFTRKKLKEELGALSATSNIVYKILLAMPIILIALIMVLNPSYFAPLFTKFAGRVVLFLIVAIYVLYILIVRRIVNVKE